MTTPETALPEEHLCTICLRPHRAALTPTAPPLGVERLRPWLRHHVWCNCKTDDPPGAERCKCGLRAALAAESDTPERPA